MSDEEYPTKRADADLIVRAVNEHDALNAVAGDTAWHHKIIVLPPGSKTMPQRPAELADQFDDVVMKDLALAQAQTVDQYVLVGTGTNGQPTGRMFSASCRLLQEIHFKAAGG